MEITADSIIGFASKSMKSTLEAICEALECQPADLLEYRKDEQLSDRQVR